MKSAKKLVKKPTSKLNSVKVYGCSKCSCSNKAVKSNQKGFNNLCGM